MACGGKFIWAALHGKFGTGSLMRLMSLKMAFGTGFAKLEKN
jgi:hypothetical protein